MPGRWRTDRVEAARGPMLAVTEPGVRKITVMGPTQLLKTELINNIVGYFIDQDPAPMIVMQPTQAMAEAWSKDRLDKMVRDTPALQGKIKSKKSRDSENTIYHKSFPGGHITVVWPSPSQLASRPVRITLRDEVDKYEDTVEGDPSALIAERSDTFWNSLDIGVCSPTIKGRSRIEQEYLASDQRKFMVDCPHCGHTHFMEWANVRWENKDYTTAHYICPECTVVWTEQDRLKAIASGRYIATKPFSGHAGFHVNKLASPWQPLSTLVRKWLEAQGDQEKLKTFINTQLAETWEERGESPEYMRLYERRENYPINSIPEGVVFLTSFTDVQKDRLETEIVGWGRGKQSWSIDYRVHMGDTSNAKTYDPLDEMLNETWVTPDGRELRIRAAGIDSGFNTQDVYNWARKYVGTNRVIVTKGRDEQQNILSVPTAVDLNQSGAKVRRGIKVFHIGVSTLKSELYGWLNLNAAGDDGIYPTGYCHFPQYDEYFFKMLTAEQLVKRNVSGKLKYVWVKKFERNEALDCRIGNRAVATYIGMDRFKDEHWDRLEGKFKEPVEETPVEPEPPKPQEPKKPEIRRPQLPQSSFWGKHGRKSFWDR